MFGPSIPRGIVLILWGSFLLASQSGAASNFAVDVDANGIALRGYDPVAYFAVGRPTKGNAEYSANAAGATYHFSSIDNRNLFAANPGKYMPAYGGFCAFGVGRGMKITGDPIAWKIVDGRLYINSSLDALERWSKDIPGNIKKADAFWPTIKDKNPADL